jgi:dolichol-phosphate mannosyltransferase
MALTATPGVPQAPSAQTMADGPRPAVLSVVVPTFNEQENVAEIVKRLDATLAGLDWEVVFVDDDSNDGTLAALHRLARTDPRVRFLHRVGRRGLASAVVEGVLSTSAPFIAVMDADLQHDESRLPVMLDRLRTSDSDIVVGSRYMVEGGVDAWQKSRRAISRIATSMAQLLMRANVTDPMSGFFMVKRDAFDRSVRHLSSIGYKILFDVLMSARPALKIAEVPYVFRNRVHGESKLDSAVTLDYLMLVLDKLVGRFVPIRFVMFGFVGGLGVIVHMALLALLFEVMQVGFVASQVVAAVAAMTFNFFTNNAFTYRDKRLKGAWQIITGLLTFYAVCTIGALSNVGVAAFLFQHENSWWVAGLAGILVGAVWNYAVSSIFTWRK